MSNRDLEFLKRRREERWGQWAEFYDGPHKEIFKPLFDHLYDALTEDIYIDLTEDFHEDVEKIVGQKIGQLVKKFFDEATSKK